ncbi:hypothetical protein MP228_006799 [Amoeboaphelidium protococcarum]|nr:hypothetical protein MP228_006799 [Amoeboaphelidium protococcarum]
MTSVNANNKLDMSLDAIREQRRSNRNNDSAGGRRRASNSRARGARPVGNQRPAHPAVADVSVDVGQKMLVSNLDFKVTEADLKELFSTAGPLKKVSLSFDSSGKSKGSAEVIFIRKQDALYAIKKYNGVALDGRPMRLEMVARISGAETASIQSRLSQPDDRRGGNGGAIRSRPTSSRPARVDAKGGRPGGQRGRRQRKREDGPQKTAEQLDAEMDQYMQKTSGDTKMDVNISNSANAAVQDVEMV